MMVCNRCAEWVAWPRGLLRSVEPGVLQQIQHPQHGVHGRADLVGHHGQELRLGTVGRLRFVPRPGQLLLTADLVAHIPRRAAITEEAATASNKAPH
jgi:hypothetical protein